MKLIDSHVHFWDPQQITYAWLANAPALNRAYLPDHVPARVGNDDITGIVFVEADCDPAQGLMEADFVTTLAHQDPRVRAYQRCDPLGYLSRCSQTTPPRKRRAPSPSRRTRRILHPTQLYRRRPIPRPL